MPARVSIEVKGIKQLSAALKDEELYSKPWREGMNAVGQLGERIAASHAPRGATGQLEAKISYGVQKKPFPTWVAIRERARRRSPKYPKGYPYPTLLNYSSKHGHAGWFTRPLGQLGNQVGPVLNRISKEVEAQWRFKTQGTL